MEILEGVFLCSKKWKFWGGGGDLHEIPSTVVVLIFSGTTQYKEKVELIFAYLISFVPTSFFLSNFSSSVLARRKI